MSNETKDLILKPCETDVLDQSGKHKFIPNVRGVGHETKLFEIGHMSR